MKRRIHTFIILLFFGLQFAIAQVSNLVGGESSVKMNFNKISVKTKKRFNQAKSNNVERVIPLDDLDCLKDPRTGECIDIIDSGGSSDSTEAGSTSGSLSVSLTGVASYSIPIMVPPGIKDVVPNIAVSYSSQGSNGLAGWGWNISGLSTISRIPATKYYDNKHDGIDFKDDRFSLDG